MPDAVIFDVDGTLVDSVDFHAEAWRRTFAHFDHAVSFEAIRGQIGKGGDQLMPVFLSDDEVERRGKEMESFRKELFSRDYRARVRGFPGARELFQALKGRGKRVALASSAKGDELEAYKKAAGIQGLTDVDTSSDDAAKSKPHPDIFQAALAKLALPPDRALVIGDSPYDAEAAGKAGIAAIGVLCGGFPEADLRDAGATRVYRDPAHLLQAIDEWLD